MTPDVSVIIPIHNAAARIDRTLNALRSQTLRNIELVCVLDCPTDGTDTIVARHAAADQRIVVVRNPKNLGVANSRNAGLDAARGKYVGFCDHDDFCTPDMFRTLLDEARRTNADVASSNAHVIQPDGRQEYWRIADTRPAAMIESIILPMQSRHQTQRLSHCIWHSIYRAEFLRDKGIRFPDREQYMDEDRLFNLQVYLSTSRVAHLDEAYYTWDKHLDSTSATDTHRLAQRAIARLEFITDQTSRHAADGGGVFCKKPVSRHSTASSPSTSSPCCPTTAPCRTPTRCASPRSFAVSTTRPSTPTSNSAL